MTPPPLTRPGIQRRRRRQRRMRRALGIVLAVGVAAGALAALPAGAAEGRYSASAEESLVDIQAFWSATLPATYGRRFDPIPTSRIHPYSSADPPPGCGTRRDTPYRQVAGNAFYCEDGDFIAYDVELLIPRLRDRYGDVAVGLVLAHEMGHAIQARVGAPPGAFVTTELQADCFAGAWARRVAQGDGTRLRLSHDDLDRALAGFLELRDPSGTPGDAAGAHGNAFDRVSAFQDGLTGGASACRGYVTDPPQVTQAEFTSAEDQAVNGDPPLDESLPLVTRSLDAYWDRAVRRYGSAPRLRASQAAIPSCPGTSDGGVLVDSVRYCPENRTIVYRAATLEDAAGSIGDMAAGVYVAAAWASAVQDDLGYEVGSGSARERAICLTGAWAGAVEGGSGTTSPSAAISFSPGDLDEIIAVFVADDVRSGRVEHPRAFERVAQFRTGFEGGPAACLDV